MKLKDSRAWGLAWPDPRASDSVCVPGPRAPGSVPVPVPGGECSTSHPQAPRSPVLPAARRRPRPCPAVLGAAGAASSPPAGGAVPPGAARRPLLAEAEAARRGGWAASPPRSAVSTGVGEDPRGDRGSRGKWLPDSAAAAASVLWRPAVNPWGGRRRGLAPERPGFPPPDRPARCPRRWRAPPGVCPLPPTSAARANPWPFTPLRPDLPLRRALRLRDDLRCCSAGGSPELV